MVVFCCYLQIKIWENSDWSKWLHPKSVWSRGGQVIRQWTTFILCFSPDPGHPSVGQLWRDNCTTSYLLLLASGLHLSPGLFTKKFLEPRSSSFMLLGGFNYSLSLVFNWGALPLWRHGQFHLTDRYCMPVCQRLKVHLFASSKLEQDRFSSAWPLWPPSTTNKWVISQKLSIVSVCCLELNSYPSYW